MHALQLHYTSCRRGQSGSAGFQVRAASQGISTEEQREIVRRTLYRPPRDLPAEADEEAIRTSYPRSFRGFTLESGRFVLALSSYVGQDYSGRWGNYFVHALVFEDGLGERWPVDLYEWDGWETRLTATEDTSEMPGPLPAAEFDDVPAAASFSLEELQQFLHEGAARDVTLDAMIRAVFARGESSRRVVIRDTDLNGLFWIACLEKAFPAQYQAGLDLCSYQFDPRTCAAINSTTGTTDFLFDERERRFQFFVFEPSDGVLPDVPAAQAEYANAIAGWMATDPERLAAFHVFATGFEHGAVDPDLELLLELFRLSFPSAVPPGEERLASVLGFARTHAKPTSWPALIVLADRLGASVSDGRRLELLLRFVIEGAAVTASSGDRALAVAAFVRLFDAALQQPEGTPDPLPAARAALETRIRPTRAEIADGMLEPARVQRAWDRLRHIPDPRLPLFMAELVTALVAKERRPVFAQPEIERAILETAGTGRGSAAVIDAVLAPFAGALREIVGIVQRIAAALDRGCADPAATARAKRALGAGLWRVATHETEEFRVDLRAALDAPETWDVLLGEWAESLRIPSRTVLRTYFRDVLPRVPGFGKVHRGSLVEMFLQSLPAAKRPAVAFEMIQDQFVRRLPPEQAFTVLSWASCLVPLDPDARGGQLAAQVVGDEAKVLKVTLEPDRVALRRCVAQARRPAVMVCTPYATLPTALRQVDRGTYEEFLWLFLPAALASALDVRSHAGVLAAAYVPEFEHSFRTAYHRLLRIDPKAGLGAAVQMGLLYALGALFPDMGGDAGISATAPPEMLRIETLDFMKQQLALIGARTFAQVDQFVSAKRLTPAARNAWDEILRASRHEGGSGLQRLWPFRK